MEPDQQQDPDGELERRDQGRDDRRSRNAELGEISGRSAEPLELEIG